MKWKLLLFLKVILSLNFFPHLQLIEMVIGTALMGEDVDREIIRKEERGDVDDQNAPEVTDLLKSFAYWRFQ